MIKESLKKWKSKSTLLKDPQVHFTMYVENIKSAKQFYSTLLNWDFDDSNSDDSLKIKSKKEGQHIGTLQSIKLNPLDEKTTNFECAIVVEIWCCSCPITDFRKSSRVTSYCFALPFNLN